MSAVPWAQIAQDAGRGSHALVGAAITGIPGPLEKKYRKYAESELDRLSSGGGGMTPSQRAMLQMEARGQIGSALEQQRAQVARGSATGDGASGQQQAMQRDLSRVQVGAEQQASSNIRQQDLEMASRQREAALAHLRNSIELAWRRKMGAMEHYKAATPFDTGYSSGQTQRSNVGSQMSSAAEMFGGGSSGATSSGAGA
jgi:hypothetical protein